MKFKKWEIALIVALAVTLLAGIGSGAAREQSGLSDKLIRLHVVANSNSPEDQALKLKARDRILDSLSGVLDGVTDRDTAIGLISENLDRIVAVSEDEIRSEGYDYSVTARVDYEQFPTRNYDTFSLPAGGYEALRVIIGSGQGANWWCVIFPPLCTSAAFGGGQGAFGDLSKDQVSLITGDSPRYVVKFKTIEIIDKVRGWLGI